MKKSIPIRDFVYLCIILLIILISVCTLMLSDIPSANENLNFAATAVSIVLAVIAIVYTMVDSSSQKQNALLMRDNIEELNESVKSIQDTTSSLKNELEKIEELKDEMSEFNNWRTIVISKIDEVLKSTQVNQSEEIKVVEQLKETLSNTPTSFVVSSNQKIEWNIIDMVDDQVYQKKSNGWTIKELFQLYNEYCPEEYLQYSRFYRLIQKLINQGHLYRKEDKLYRKQFSN